MSEEITLERVQALVTRGPYHQWLGLQVVAVHDDGIELKATWREEWVVNPDRRYTHGGVLATLVDLGADWAMVSKTGRGVPTINLHVDYHAPAMPGDLTIRGKIVRMGRPVLHGRSACVRPGRQTRCQRPRHLSHRRPEAMIFHNLGDLIGVTVTSTKSRSSISAASRLRVSSPMHISMPWRMACARALSRRGLARGDRVAILSANRAEFLATYFGIMRAGFVAVPVNFKFPSETIHFILRDAGAKLLFCDKRRSIAAPDSIPHVQFGNDGPRGFDGFLEPGPFNAIVPSPREPAMFLYTSGSTGRPKGVVLSHQSHLWVVQMRLAPDLHRHRYLIAAPLYHMNALALSKLACAAHAATVLLPQFTADAYIEAVGRFRCTWLTAVPPMMAMMLREKALLAATDLSSVEFVRMGSAPVSESLMAAISAALPRACVTNAYGTTEAGPVVFGPHPAHLPQPAMSVGYPHPEVKLRLVAGNDRNVGPCLRCVVLPS